MSIMDPVVDAKDSLRAATAFGGPETMGDVKKRYGDFDLPRVKLKIGGKKFKTGELGVAVGDVHIELSCTFEASVATFRLYGVYEKGKGFDYNSVKEHIVMGRSLEIMLGYQKNVETVFIGFICGVNFGFDGQRMAYIEVTAMDVKGVLMGGTYANQLTATVYHKAVLEILERTGKSNKLTSSGGVTEIKVSRTPDDAGTRAGNDKSSPLSVEMVSESDYEFIVRAAKRYNFEFFVDRGVLLFRPAKSDTKVYLSLGPDSLLKFNIGYSITSVVGKIEARAMDPGTGKVISSSVDYKNNFSTQSDADGVVGQGVKVYVDPSITSEDEAKARVDSLMEKMSYRLGSIDAEVVGLPDLLPGRFIKIENMGVPVDNTFYVTKVTHDFTQDSGFKTRFEGCAKEVPKGGKG